MLGCLFVCFCLFFHYFYQNAELSTSKISRELCNVKLQVYALTPVCKIRRPELLIKIRLRRLSKNSHCCRTPVLNKNNLYLLCFRKIFTRVKWNNFSVQVIWFCEDLLFVSCFRATFLRNISPVCSQSFLKSH